MARSTSAVEINKFVAGLVTDANPLTFPDNASIEEENFVLNIDGSRNRRLGLDFEEFTTAVTTSIASASTIEPAFSSFKWDNAGGDPDKSLLVIQIGSELKFFDLDSAPICGGFISTYDFTSADDTQNFSYAVVDGILVVATGVKTITTFEYSSSDGSISNSTFTLMVRDFWGVEDVISVDLYDRLDVRPGSTTNAHTYNLRNSTWALPRLPSNSETVSDPVNHFFASSSSKYPSNSDSVNAALYADPNDTDNRLVERFFAGDLVKNPRGTIAAPTGYFIIDALERGTSRLAKEAELRSTYSLSYSVTDLPDDTTPGGPKCVTEFAGRIFYAGFSGEIIDGDARSPRMSSYVLFSRLVRSVNDINRCYQEGDPTSKDQPDLVATDGGYFRVNGAYGIEALVNVGTSLLILAKNGVWRVYGGSDYGFDATNYVVERVSDHGIISLDSVVVVDNAIMFWGEDGIYHVHIDGNSGGWVNENITFGRIQNLYEVIPIADKRKAKGAYDSFQRCVRWVYYNRFSDDTETKELILDINLKAFYLNAIKQFDGTALPRLLAPFNVNPYQITLDTTAVQVSGVQVQAAGVDVVYPIENVLGNDIKEIAYLVITQIDPVVKYVFAFYRNPDYRDWYSSDNIGVDAAAYMITGYMSDGPSGKDFIRQKSVPYLFVHCKRTENGFEEDINGDFVPINQSSCLVQPRWEWSDTSNSNRWGNQFEAYRYKKIYYPVLVTDDFDTGFATVVTKNKLRGRGKVLSLKFSTQPYKNLHLYGWSMIMSVAGNV